MYLGAWMKALVCTMACLLANSLASLQHSNDDGAVRMQAARGRGGAQGGGAGACAHPRALPRRARPAGAATLCSLSSILLSLGCACGHAPGLDSILPSLGCAWGPCLWIGHMWHTELVAGAASR